MNKYPKLNLPAVRLRASKRGECDYIWDGLRGDWLLLTPEEWVRRHVIQWLTDSMGVESINIVQEHPVPLGGAVQRADIVVTGVGGKRVLLVECKAADVPIDASVLDQAMRYNSVIGARYIMLTNGVRHYFYETYDGKDYVRLDSVPDIKIL